MSSPRPTSPVNNAAGSTTARPSSPKPPGGPATVMRRKAAADRAEKSANQRPSSTRAAGAGGSSSTMLRLYTDESPGLKVDPVVVMTLSVVFIFSVVALHGTSTNLNNHSASDKSAQSSPRSCANSPHKHPIFSTITTTRSILVGALLQRHHLFDPPHPLLPLRRLLANPKLPR
ncbi:hypothetical protein PMIN03_003269 [Paraphaeosphaeria minitans]